jgi:peptidoglycan/LPS O-acetylase OafA/YrhL
MRRTTLKQALQLSAIVIVFALLPGPVEAMARSDLLFPMIGLTVLCAAAACAIFAWPVKR